DQLADLHARLGAIGMTEPGAELARDVVACPGADTCNLSLTQSRGLADDIGVALEKAGLAEVGGVRVNISGCTNSCGQHHIADIGFVGIERRAHGRAAPGYHMLLGGRVGNMEIEFGEKAVKLPAKRASEAVVRVVGRFAETLWYVEQVRERYDLNLTVMTPRIPPDNLWQEDPDACCEMRKVEPLARALDGKAAWLTGLRRDEAATRANAPIVGLDVGRGLVKVNPLASWTHDDIESYVRDRELP